MFTWLIEFLILPYRAFYRHGPSILGMSEGKPLPQLCSSISGVSENLWVGEDNIQECHEMYSRKETAFLVLIAVLLYSWILFSALSFCMCRLIFSPFSVNPINYAAERVRHLWAPPPDSPGDKFRPQQPLPHADPRNSRRTVARNRALPQPLRPPGR